MIERIASYFGYERKGPRPYPRINNGSEAVSRGARWEMFYAEQGGLADMLTGLRQSYFEKVASLAPGDIDGLRALAMADLLARELDGRVRSVIETGKLRAAEAEHVERIAATRR